MKTQKKVLIAILVVGLQALLTACVNTAHGVAADYQHAEDKVENAVK